uniref:Uncharacterized protein n=1 Tax=Spermophilus dauricus TaxID=99837 RepID=A0A8C9UM81_SPEDA
QKRNPAPLHIPFGYVVANEKWHRSQFLPVQKILHSLSLKLIWWQKMATEKALFKLEILVSFKGL